MSPMRATFLAVALALAATGPACGSHGFGDGNDAGSDSPFAGQDGYFSGDSPTGDAPTSNNGCDGTCTAVGGTCSGGVCTIVDNEGSVSTATETQLQGGGSADSQFAFQYPYDQTVWGRGLLSATLQFGGTSANAVYVHITSPTLDYSGYFAPPSGPVRVALSQPMWDAVLAAVTSSKDAVKVDVTKLFMGNVTGPISETWYVAQGSLRGTIYYETYDSTILGGIGSVGIMQIQPGATTPTMVKKGCGNVCHTASADGSTLVANTVLGFGSASYDLKTAASTIYAAPGLIFTYGGIYPDGSFLMSATNYRTWIPGGISRLYDTKTGANIPAPGWDGKVSNGGTTAFSPDGKKLAFVHEDKSGSVLSVMDFDVSTKTFSNLVDVANHPGSYVAWPAFTPDSQYVVYHVGSSDQFETDSGNTGDVYAVNLSTLATRRLDALDGYVGGTSNTYLPAKDPNLSFAPTVLPEAVGGFFWVVFTTHRSYGNILPSQDNGDEYGKLWVAALDINAPSGTDGSHPAFFLDGQERNADNLRGFWVLDPCKADGQTCGSGDECCGGYCRSEDGGALQCVPPPGGCAHEYEKCTTSADCCDSGDECINGKCAVVVN